MIFIGDTDFDEENDREDIDDLRAYKPLNKDKKGRQRGLWNDPTFPKDGWIHINCYPLEVDVHICDMGCGQSNIRFVHELWHNETKQRIQVGKECGVLLIHKYVPKNYKDNIVLMAQRNAINKDQKRKRNEKKYLDIINNEQNKSVDYVEELNKESEKQRLSYELNRNKYKDWHRFIIKLKSIKDIISTLIEIMYFENFSVEFRHKITNKKIKISIITYEYTHDNSFAFYKIHVLINKVETIGNIEFDTISKAINHLHITYNWAKENLL